MSKGGDSAAAFGARLRALRVERGLAQAAVAERADVSVELVSRIERGLCHPSVPSLVALCRALGTSPNALLDFGDEPVRNRELDDLVRVARELPRSRRRDLHRIAETFAHYERSR